MEKVDSEKIKKLHEVNLKGIFDVLIQKRTFRKWPFFIAILIGLSTCVWLLIVSADLTKVLNSTSALIQTVFPGLLGFSLGGYAIVVGFSNADLIKQSTKTDKHNIYQILSGIFALSILIQVVATIIGIIVYWCLNIDVCSVFKIHSPPLLADIVNSLLLFILFSSSLYSLILIPYVVTNLFTLSQLNSLYYTVIKAKEDSAL
jgi:hypothetical protein